MITVFKITCHLNGEKVNGLPDLYFSKKEYAINTVRAMENIILQNTDQGITFQGEEVEVFDDPDEIINQFVDGFDKAFSTKKKKPKS